VIPADVVDLLAAVVTALDVPIPASGDDERKFTQLLERRRTAVHVVLADVVASGEITVYDATAIRKRVEASPVNYEPYTA
jgi:hypothetical protein